MKRRVSDYFTSGEHALRAAIDDIASQLGVAVDGRFDFTVKVAVPDESADKLAMLINFVVEAARRALSELQDQNARLAELDRMKSTFLANVSHELRTPLALILGPADKLLGSGALTADQRRDLEVAVRNARSLLRTVNDLLDVSRLEAGKLAPRFAQVDLTDLVRQTCAMFEDLARQRGVELGVAAPASVPAQVDPDMIQRVLVNLLSNAFKFGAGGGRIACRLATSGARAVLSVEDHGPGVPADMRQKIFERFLQVEGEATRRHGGTGLGLAIAKELVEMHHGTITEEDPPGGGALFLVTLPLGAPAGAHVGRAPERATALPSALSTLVADTVSRASCPADVLSGPPEDRGLVLVVEDNPEMNRFIAETLSRDYRVVQAFDGRQGLARAREHRPDLIVSDLMMPEVSGDEMIAALQRDERLGAIPVVVLTAKADDDLKLSLLRRGAADYLTKPFSAEELLARARNLVTAKRARDLLQGELSSTKADLEDLAREVSLRRHELERALEEARASRDEVERLLHLRDEFISVASHELRTPLTPLNLQTRMIETVLRSDVPAEAKEKKIRSFLEISRRQIDAMTRLVEMLLDVSRFRLGGLLLEVEEGVDLGEIVRDVVERLRPESDTARCPVTMQAPEARIVGRWDRLRLEQLVANLLGNAIKYGHGQPIEIVIAGYEGGAEISVHDHGVGIGEADQARIFNRFERAGSTRMFGGLGLGLYIVRQIVAAHGGTIRVESALSRGSTFIVDLPLAAPEREPIAANTVDAVDAAA